MTRNGTRIQNAQANLLAAKIAREALDAGLDVNYPAPADDCTEAEFDKWNDEYEDAREERGGFRIDDAVREAEAELIRATRDAIVPITPKANRADAEMVYAVALGETKPHAFMKTRSRVLDLAMRIDTATIR